MDVSTGKLTDTIIRDSFRIVVNAHNKVAHRVFWLGVWNIVLTVWLVLK